MSVAAIDRPVERASTPTRGREWSGTLLNAYLVAFFVFMFAPLAIMVIAAFNAYPNPSITPWAGFTLEWFRAIPDDARMVSGLGNSALIAAGVIAIAVPLGLAGALVLSRLETGNALLYTVLVSPIMMPGIVLGVTSMIFWRDAFGVQAGLFTAMLAQASFIASYCMLLIMARLSRQDRTLDEAAADLGATPLFALRRITLPFLMPALVSAALIAFLQSIENFPTTFFSIGPDHTLVTEIASRMRFGLSPMINAIGVLFILVTVIVAVLWSWLRTRERTTRERRTVPART